METGKWKTLCLGRNNLLHQYRLEANWLESSLEGKAPAILANSKLTVTATRALMANKDSSPLGCFTESVADVDWGGNAPSLLTSHETHLKALGPALQSRETLK